MNGKDKTVYIIIGCDTDPDRPGFVDGAEGEGRSWRGLTEGVPLFKELAKDIKDDAGNPPRITWLLRVDEQMKAVHGDYAWVLRNFQKQLSELEAAGDELGWHPHFWRLDKASGKWYQEVFDVAWQVSMLEEAYGAYVSALPGRAKSVRMGWDFHNSATLKKISDLGVLVDFSALPGLRTKTPSRDDRPYNIFDWYDAPQVPYHPAADNYARMAAPKDGSLTILEIPISASRSRVWGLISGLQMARKMKDPAQVVRSLCRPTFFINITGKPNLFAPVVSELDKTLTKSRDRDVFFAAYFHADELLDNKSSLYSRFNMISNLETIARVCLSRGAEFRFVNAADSPAQYKANWQTT